MIGNDIIDINATYFKINWNRPGLSEKIFTKNEHILIKKSFNPGLISPLLWSLKESAYKIYIQQKKMREFSPLTFACKIFSINKLNCLGEVSVDKSGLKCLYKTYSELNKKFISTIAYLNDEDLKATIIQKNFILSDSTYEVQHKETCLQLIKFISKRINQPAVAIKIIKNSDDIPEVFFKNERINLSLSISHHGNYGSFAVLFHRNYKRK